VVACSQAAVFNHNVGVIDEKPRLYKLPLQSRKNQPQVFIQSVRIEAIRDYYLHVGPAYWVERAYASCVLVANRFTGGRVSQIVIAIQCLRPYP